MKLPFTAQQFLEVFKQYNLYVFPAQLVLVVLALIAFALCFKPTRLKTIYVSGLLSLLWLWMAIAYHFMFFAIINPAAYLFGSLFIIQSVLFIWYGITKKRLYFAWRLDLRGIVAGLMLLFAWIVYPVMGKWLGHTYPANPTFGLPCPTTIFTLALLLCCRTKIPFVLPVIPLLWTALGYSAATQLGIKEDLGLLLAGISFLLIIIFNQNQPKQHEGILSKNTG